MQQNTTADNKHDGSPSYTRVKPLPALDQNGNEDYDNRIVAPTKLVRPTSILPPLKKTLAYKQKDSGVAIGPTGN